MHSIPRFHLKKDLTSKNTFENKSLSQYQHMDPHSNVRGYINNIE